MVKQFITYTPLSTTHNKVSNLGFSGISFLAFPLLLLFFPSVTFNLLTAEVFPWATIVFLIYTRKYHAWLLLFSAYLFISALIVIAITDEFFEAIRSLSAFLNALLGFELVLMLSNKHIKQLLLLLKYIFISLFILGFLQYFSAIDFLDPLISFLVPRASSSSLSFMGRGVTLLSSEPARAGVELVFIYLVVKTVFINKQLHFYADVFIALFLLFVIQSSMAMMLFLVYTILAYRLKLVLIIVLGMLIFPFLNIGGSGRAFNLVIELMEQSSYKDALYILFNTSGHRVISIFSSYTYGLLNPFGGGVGNWMNSSIDALNMTGIDLSDMNYFKRYGDGEAVSIRASGYVTNLMVDTGVVGTLLFFYYLQKRFKKFSAFLKEKKEIFWLFIVKILFVGSVGTPVSFICVALIMRYQQTRTVTG